MFGTITNKDDTVGSLTSTQHDVLVGSMLGDGTLRRQGNRKNALLEVNHSIKHHQYVDWKYGHFAQLTKSPPKQRQGRGVRVAYRFTTRSLPEFTEYYLQYYCGGKKVIPTDLKLSPLSLAVWFMDDGARSRSSFYLNTQQFIVVEQQLLQNALLKLGIRSSLNRDKIYFRIRVASGSAGRMQSMIAPFVLPCLRYKLINDPVTTDSKDESSLLLAGSHADAYKTQLSDMAHQPKSQV